MEDRVYRDMALLQDQHWWFRARRDILLAVIKQLQLPDQADILEIGCGAGGNLGMLKQFGRVSAMEMDDRAIAKAKKISGLKIDKGRLPDHIPYSCQFDLICLFDVLEHIENDLDAVLKIVRRLKSTGQIIITVPAHMFLFGSHDKNMHHFRRYSKKRLKKILTGSGFKIQKITYFNTILFPVVVMTRCLDFFRKDQNAIGYDTPNPFLNGILYRIFRMERHIINITNLPVGASLIAVCKRN